jgi:hypothetical protein
MKPIAAWFEGDNQMILAIPKLDRSMENLMLALRQNQTIFSAFIVVKTLSGRKEVKVLFCQFLELHNHTAGISTIT